MKRLTKALALLVLLMGIAVSAVFAANPHFISSKTDAHLDGAGNLLIDFKIAGLGDNVSTTITAHADATSLYACKNNGGNFPSDPKKQEFTGPVEASVDATSGKNGQIEATVVLSPPMGTPPLYCPGNQVATLVQVTYSNVYVSEPHAGVDFVSGVFSAILDPDFFS